MSKTINRAKFLSGRSMIALAVAGLVAMPVAAEHGYTNYQSELFDYAQVINVSPVIETYRVSSPVEQCWDERVAVEHSSRDYSASGHHKDSKTSMILGAIIGGAIANQVGKRGGGKARDVATVAGAVLGGSIGRDIKHDNRDRYHGGRSNHYQPVRYETVQRCEMEENFVTKEQVVAYDVSYKYRGNVFHTQTDQHPGNRIKVKLTINPV